jgi:hypothetical protein
MTKLGIIKKKWGNATDAQSSKYKKPLEALARTRHISKGVE